MFRFRRPEIENIRADYAKHADFCAAFEIDMQRLYLLASCRTTISAASNALKLARSAFGK